MSSYLNIYLERKPEYGGEKLLLCSISSASDIYNIFFDNNIGVKDEDGYHEFSHSDFDSIIDDLTEDVSKTLLETTHLKENLPLVSEKESISEMLDQISSNKDYIEWLRHRRSYLMALGIILSDVGESWSDFSKLYWKID